MRLFELKKINNKFKIRYIFQIFLIFIFISILVGSFYLKKNFANESIDEILFYLKNGIENSSSSVFVLAIKSCILYIIIIFIITIIIFYNILINKKLYININYYKVIAKKVKNDIKTIRKKRYKKSIRLYPFDFIIKHRVIFIIIYIIIFSIISFNNIKGFQFVKNNIVSSEFIESNYNEIDSSKVVFQEKKNLIYIYLESFETTFFTSKQGGDWDYEVIDEMYELLFDEDSTCFSCDNDTIGMYMTEGASWTTAAIVANSTGLPFKIPIDGNSYHSSNFMSGAYAIGDILKDKGYYNEVISSARTSFGGLSEYYKKHGDYSIIDIDSLDEYGLDISDTDLGDWGFNDNYLFKIAKKRLSKISKSDTPFNLTLIGIDTHFTDGYKGDYTIDEYDTQYENVYATESMLVYDFISWVKRQDFYEDTVIVIVGDHLSMQNEFFKNNDSSKRLVYSVIINSTKKSENNSRIYSAIDMLPTTLSAMGAEIYKDQIALGVNLFSSKETLLEKYGIAEYNEKILLKSEFYNNVILGDDYEKMQEEEVE